MAKKLVLIILLIVATLSLTVMNKPSELSLNGKNINVDIADSSIERAQGLSGRESLPEGEGLLFAYSKADFYSFWMKDMKFAIDIIWFDENFEVIDITKNLTPDTYPQAFTPRKPAKYVLEVAAGLSDKNSWEVGQKAQLSNNLKGHTNYDR